MNIKNFRPLVDVGRSGGSGSQPAHGAVNGALSTAARTQNDRSTLDVYQYARGSIELGRGAAAGTRHTQIARLEAQVREGRYAPNLEQIAQEILAEADTAVTLSSMLRA